MVVNYFLAKLPSVAVANGPYSVSPGGNVTFSSSGSYDPTSSHTIRRQLLSELSGHRQGAWDLNNDGTDEMKGYPQFSVQSA